MSVTDQKTFNQKLKDYGKAALPVLIPLVGLKTKQERALIGFYVEEKSYYELADELNMTTESVGNLICKAKKEFNKKLEGQKAVLPLEILPYLDLFNDKKRS